MKKYSIAVLLVFIGLTLTFAQSTKKQKRKNKKDLVVVTGQITQTASFCGGARPPKQLMDELKTPKPFVGKKIYIRTGEQNNIDAKVICAIVADTSGKFSIKLPAGKYCIVEENKVKMPEFAEFKNNENYKYVGDDCVKEWIKECVQTFDVIKGQQLELNINFNKPCFYNAGKPCWQFVGKLTE